MGNRYSQLPARSLPRSSSEGLGGEDSRPSTPNSSLACTNTEEHENTHQQLTHKENARAKLQQLQNKLLQDLQSLVDQKRAERLYRTHVCRTNILLVYGEGKRERKLAEELQRCLEREGKVVEGPWSIKSGEHILNAWEKLSSRALAVVVLVSPAIFQDTGLCSCLLEMRHSHPDSITPLFLEPMSLLGVPQSLAFLNHTNGRWVPENHWDPRPFIRSLLKKCQCFRNICREIKALQTLVGELQLNPDYVCPCGTC